MRSDMILASPPKIPPKNTETPVQFSPPEGLFLLLHFPQPSRFHIDQHAISRIIQIIIYN